MSQKGQIRCAGPATWVILVMNPRHGNAAVAWIGQRSLYPPLICAERTQAAGPSAHRQAGSAGRWPAERDLVLSAEPTAAAFPTHRAGLRWFARKRSVAPAKQHGWHRWKYTRPTCPASNYVHINCLSGTRVVLSRTRLSESF